MNLKDKNLALFMNFLKKIIPSPIKNLIKKNINSYRHAFRQRTIQVNRHGINYELDLREFIDYSIYKYGYFEPDTAKAISKLCRPHMTVLDIGANNGCHTLLFAKLVSPQGKVFAFEPMSWAFSRLTKNISLNSFNNITTSRIALSNQNQINTTISFACSWPITNNTSFQAHPIHKGLMMEDNTNMVTLDSYCFENNLSTIDLIKIDVDGYELKVSEGAINTIKKHLPIIIMELSDYTLNDVGDRIEDLVSFYLNIGYTFYNESTFRLIPDKATILSLIPPQKTINVILRPPNKKYES